ncbi:MAG: ASCH domain-containing protein [Candidatus Bathyarchaeia archaeon]
MEYKQLNFKKEYREALKDGRKTTTIRVNAHVKPGDLVELIAGGVSCGYAIVRSVTRKKLLELNDEDARKDGFKNRMELIKALKRHYPSLTPETYVYIINFRRIH